MFNIIDHQITMKNEGEGDSKGIEVDVVTGEPKSLENTQWVVITPGSMRTQVTAFSAKVMENGTLVLLDSSLKIIHAFSDKNWKEFFKL